MIPIRPDLYHFFLGGETQYYILHGHIGTYLSRTLNQIYPTRKDIKIHSAHNSHDMVQ